MAPLTAHHIIFYSCPLSLSLLLFLSIFGCPRSTASHLYTRCTILCEDVTLFGPVCMQERGYAPISSWVALVVPTPLLDRGLIYIAKTARSSYSRRLYIKAYVQNMASSWSSTLLELCEIRNSKTITLTQILAGAYLWSPIHRISTLYGQYILTVEARRPHHPVLIGSILARASSTSQVLRNSCL